MVRAERVVSSREIRAAGAGRGACGNVENRLAIEASLGTADNARGVIGVLPAFGDTKVGHSSPRVRAYVGLEQRFAIFVDDRALTRLDDPESVEMLDSGFAARDHVQSLWFGEAVFFDEIFFRFHGLLFGHAGAT